MSLTDKLLIFIDYEDHPSVRDISNPTMIDFRQNIVDEVDPSEETSEYESDFHSAASEEAHTIKSKVVKSTKSI